MWKSLKTFLYKLLLFAVALIGIAVISSIIASSGTQFAPFSMIFAAIAVPFVAYRIIKYPLETTNNPSASSQSSNSRKTKSTAVPASSPHKYNEPNKSESLSHTIIVEVGGQGGSGSSNRSISASEDTYGLPSKGKVDAKFVPANDSVVVAGFRINGPIFIGKAKEQYFFSEPALIDPSLPVLKAAVTDPLGYYPDYSALNPSQRGRYLSWLAEGRGETEELGYPFMYFYGFERYVLRTAQNDTEGERQQNLEAIVREIARLKLCLSHSKSFITYANQLLDVIYVLFWPQRLHERSVDCPNRSIIAARFAIALHANTGVQSVLDSDWALHWYLGQGESSISKSVREHYPVLRALFRQSYEQLQGGGVKVPTCKTKLKLTVTTASRGLDDVCTIPVPVDWCDPTALKGPLKQLTTVAEKAMPSLRALSRAIVQEDGTAILGAWPRGVSLDAVPNVKRMAETLSEFCRASPSVVLGELAEKAGMASPENLTKSRLALLASALDACGRVMVPDPLLGTTTPKSNETVRTYAGIRPSSLSPAAKAIELHLRLGSILAMADGTVHDNEKSALNQIILAHPHEVERQYLAEYLEWRLTQAPSIAGLKQHIEQLSPEAKNTLAKQLVELALSDGALPRGEIKQLEKLFLQLGFESSLVSQYLHAVPITASPSPASATKPSAVQASAPGVVLDPELLRTHAHATRDIQSVLSEIFDDETPEEIIDVAPISTDPKGQVEWYSGRLDAAHIELVKWVVTKDEWSLAEFKQRCEGLKLLPDGAMDTINQAAYQTLGDSLIEPGDPIAVYLDVLPR